MKKYGRAIIYALMLSAVAASFALLVAVYIVKCPFDLPVHRVMRETQPKTFGDGKMLVETDVNDVNARLLTRCEESGLLPDGLEVSEIECVFIETPASGVNTAYINIIDNNLFGTVFSFKCGWELSLGKDGVTVAFSDIRLGKYEIPYLGGFFWRILRLPDGFSVPPETKMQYLSEILVTPGGDVTLTYDYEPAALAAELNGILALSDERKIEFHKESMDSELIRFAETKAVTPEEAVTLVNRFEKSPETFLSLCYLLNAQGIEKLAAAFGEAYYRRASAEMLAEASDNELDSGLNEFNAKLSRMLLQYLHINSNYTVADGSIYTRGIKVTPETVLKGASDAYDVEIWADGTCIKALYNIQGKTIEKVILMGE